LRVVGKRGRIDRDRRLGHFLLERQKALVALIQQQSLAQWQTPRDRERIAVARRVHDRERARGLHDDLIERAGSEPRVERQRDRAGAHRSEEKFDELRSIADEHGHALARTHTQTRDHSCDRIHARVEIAISTYAFTPAKQINNGDLVGQAPRDVIEEKSEIALAVLALHRVKCDRKETPFAIPAQE